MIRQHNKKVYVIRKTFKLFRSHIGKIFMVINKSDGKTEGEKKVAQLCERSFLKLWSYPNLFKQKGKELCDNIILFDKTIILISEKTKHDFNYDYSLYKNEDSQKTIGNRHIDILWKRWCKELKSSENQLDGAERWIKKHPDQIFLDSKCQNKFPLKIPDITELKFIKISVINGLNNVNILREKACNGELDYELPIDMILFKININNIIHVLDDYTFPIIMKELDTATDFINFFEKKEAFLKSGKTPIGILDLDLLPIFLTNIDYKKCCYSFKSLEAVYNKMDLVIIDNPEDPYPDFIQSQDYQKMKEENKISYFWDRLIDDCAQTALDGELVGEQNINQTNEILMIMAKETRLSRKILAEAYLEVIENYDYTASHRGRVIQSPCNNKVMYIFFQINKLSEETYEEYRDRRRKLTEMYCWVVNANFRKINYIVAITSEPPKFNLYLSRDFILYPCQKLSSKDKRTILKMQKELNILTCIKKI